MMDVIHVPRHPLKRMANVGKTRSKRVVMGVRARFWGDRNPLLVGFSGIGMGFIPYRNRQDK